MTCWRPWNCRGTAPLPPFSAGGLGFLAYDLKNHLEHLPQTAVDDLGLPELVLAFPRRLVVHDRRAGRFWQVSVTYEDPGGAALPRRLTTSGPLAIPWAPIGSALPGATLPGRRIFRPSAASGNTSPRATFTRST